MQTGRQDKKTKKKIPCIVLEHEVPWEMGQARPAADASPALKSGSEMTPWRRARCVTSLGSKWSLDLDAVKHRSLHAVGWGGGPNKTPAPCACDPAMIILRPQQRSRTKREPYTEHGWDAAACQGHLP